MVNKEAFGKCKVNKKLLVKTMVFILVLIIAMIGTFSAYAMNSDYLEPKKWDNDENIISVQLTKSSTVNVLDGVLKYYLDEKESCLYVAFFINESTLSVSRDDVRIRYTVSNKESYSAFSVSKYGIDEYDEEPDFPVYQNYSTYEHYRYTGEYISVLDFGKVKYDTQVDISLYINGHIYKNIAKLNVPPIKATTSKGSKTTAQRNSKEKTTNKSKSSKGSTERSTKFQATGTVSGKAVQNKTSKYSYAKSNVTESARKEEVGTVSYRDGQASEEKTESYSVRGKLTQHSKNIIIVAAVIAFVGLCFLIASAFMSPDKKSDDKENKEKSETDEKKI